MAAVLATGLRAGGIELVHDNFFDTVRAVVPGRAHAIVDQARGLGVNLHFVDDDHVGISCDETTTREHLSLVWKAFGLSTADADVLDESAPDALPASDRKSTRLNSSHVKIS